MVAMSVSGVKGSTSPGRPRATTRVYPFGDGSQPCTAPRFLAPQERRSGVVNCCEREPHPRATGRSPLRGRDIQLWFGFRFGLLGGGRRWKVRECWAGRRLGLCRCLWASTACTGQPLASERMWRGPEGFSVWGVPATRSARPCGGMGAGLGAAEGCACLSEGVGG